MIRSEKRTKFLKKNKESGRKHNFCFFLTLLWLLFIFFVIRKYGTKFALKFCEEIKKERRQPNAVH